MHFLESLSILIFSFVALAEPAIVVRPLTQVAQSKSITMSDVAEFHDISEATAAEVGQMKLAEGPKAGEHIEFSGSSISTLLRDHKVWRATGKPTFTIPSRVVIENIGSQPTEAQVRMELIQKWQTQCDCRVELTEISMPKVDKWQDGMNWRIRFPSEAARGSFTVALELRNREDVTIQTLWVRGQANHFRSVPVAKRQLNIGERVQPDDYQFTDREITFARDAVPDPQEIVGRRLRQSVAANGILFAGLLERERALRRGDQVKLSIGEDDWEIAMVGVAEQDGFVGDMVKVRNSRSNQMITAVVTGRGEVKVQ